MLSQDSSNYKDAPTEGIRRILEIITGEQIPRGQTLKTDKIDYIRLSTTVATNALLERKGQKHALLITKGFKDVLLIGNQSRPKIFDLNIKRPPPLYSNVVEIDERVTLVGYTYDPNLAEHAVQFDENGKVIRGLRGPGWDGNSDHLGEGPGEVVSGISGEAVRIIKKPGISYSQRSYREKKLIEITISDPDVVRNSLQTLRSQGYTSIAVVLLHSYTYPEHELLVGSIARELGFSQISLSSQLIPMIKVVPRGVSSTADAYLTPVLMDYLNGFFKGFDEKLRKGSGMTEKKEGDLRDPRVEFMSSDGGLLSLENFSGLKSILSGPAGGVVGYALTSWDEKRKQAVIGIDIGGTSTDVSRFAGRYETTYETTTAGKLYSVAVDSRSRIYMTISGITVQSPQLDINTVAAGGGSRLFWRNGVLQVGPESAGAEPGPICYRKGGLTALTDANLVLGRLIPEYFPQIFGKSEKEPLDVKSSKKALEDLKEKINAESGVVKDLDEVVYGFIRVANETMCRPIRALTESRGYATSKHILASFGGAGGQHACEIAKLLGITTILIHRHSSILSAYGLALADRVYEQQEPTSTQYNSETKPRLIERLDNLSKQVSKVLERQGFKGNQLRVERLLNMRFDGSDTSLMIKCNPGSEDKEQDFEAAFKREYKDEYGFLLESKVVVDDIKVRGIGKTFDSLGPSVFDELESLSPPPAAVSSNKVDSRYSVYFEEIGRVSDTPVYLLEKLDIGDKITGPAMIVDGTQTILIIPGAEAIVLRRQLMIKLDLGDV
ncbi:hypothetical protein Clacol_008382 [Clathrus columnatus]|uniref:5-oxoprolinase n=1 Tax=Clathrus columnatus TaxID=1419009 RepID=A0AAV5AQF3_9AGAM|nr:hypothetical protein Clacol_008382 [Clathrus columnatus]